MPDELCNFVADLANPFLQRGRVFAPAARPADFLAQSFAIGVALLQRRFQFAPFRIDREHFVDLALVVAPTSGEPAFDKIGLFANEPDVEHGRAGVAYQDLARLAPAHPQTQRAPKGRDFAAKRPHNFGVDQLKLLGVALGLACLAGVNLYLTVFVTGLAIHQHWIVLAPAYQSLAILGDPLILWISGTLYVLEFFADKVPWVDSAWDTVHTIIRPIGGALLAIRVLGQPARPSTSSSHSRRAGPASSPTPPKPRPGS